MKSQTIFRVFRRIRLKMVYTRGVTLYRIHTAGCHARNGLHAWGHPNGNEGEGGAGGEVHPRYETGTREFMNTSRNLCGYTLE